MGSKVSKVVRVMLNRNEKERIPDVDLASSGGSSGFIRRKGDSSEPKPFSRGEAMMKCKK